MNAAAVNLLEKSRISLLVGEALGVGRSLRSVGFAAACEDGDLPSLSLPRKSWGISSTSSGGRVLEGAVGTAIAAVLLVYLLSPPIRVLFRAKTHQPIR